MGMFRRLALLLGNSVALEEMWCPGIQWDAVEPLLSEEPIDVYYVQAALFSGNPKIGTLLGDLLDLFHTATVFQQGERSWTLEYVATAQNKASSAPSAGFLPDIDGEKLTWDANTGWCLTEGILHTKEHYKKQYTKFASVGTALFRKLLDEFVPSVNGTNNRNGAGFQHLYNFIRVQGPSDIPIIEDMTCANGAHWVRGFLQDQGANVSDSEVVWNVTRVQVTTTEAKEVKREDSVQWGLMVDYFRTIKELMDSSKTVLERIDSLNETLPMRYWYQHTTGKYFQLFGDSMPVPRYAEAPNPWAIPTAPTPAPPTPEIVV